MMKPISEIISEEIMRAYVLGYVHGTMGCDSLHPLTDSQRSLVDRVRDQRAKHLRAAIGASAELNREAVRERFCFTSADGNSKA